MVNSSVIFILPGALADHNFFQILEISTLADDEPWPALQQKILYLQWKGTFS
jgi:hypothetical protein